LSVELHCHSLFSVDGFSTPEEVAERAAAAGVRTLALTDHNAVGGLARCRARAGELGLGFIDGLELDVKWRGGDHHALAFGFHPADAALGALLARNWAQYEVNFARFLPIIERRFGVSRAELAAGLAARYRTHPAPVLNKWFARGFLLERGVFPDAAAASREMSAVAAEAERDLAPAEAWDFATLEETRDAVHAAGGILLLAHPAGSRPGDLAGQLALVREALAAGLDGFELYHPANTREAHFPELVAEARRLGCATSGGSDDHAAPGEAERSRPAAGPGVPGEVVASLDAALRSRHGHGLRASPS